MQRAVLKLCVLEIQNINLVALEEPNSNKPEEK